MFCCVEFVSKLIPVIIVKMTLHKGSDCVTDGCETTGFDLCSVLQVYVYQGELHIIPIPQSPAEIAHLPMFSPNKGEGVQCIRENAALTLAPLGVRQRVDQRLQG